MLLGGLILAHGGGLAALGIALVSVGLSEVVAVLIGFALVVVFFSLGQAVEIVAMVLANTAGLVLTLCCYLLRVVLLGLALGAVIAATDGKLTASWIFCGVGCSTLGWVTGVVWVAARQRLPVYDHDYQPPAGWQDGQ